MKPGFKVIKAGILSLLQDGGRFGFNHLGLCSGGPMDKEAFRWSNRLCSNPENSGVIEVSIGGLVMEAQCSCCIALTGADIPMHINRKWASPWQTHLIEIGDRIELGYARSGMRGYLAVSGGFRCEKIFGSMSTVPRDKLGGSRQDGSAIQVGEVLSCPTLQRLPQRYKLSKDLRPVRPQSNAKLRVVLGCQHETFDLDKKQLFFASEYTLTKDSDRTGCRLKGPAIMSNVGGIFSEGICHGAIQFPPDGQPIVLMCDRPTIGGYPKLGSVFSRDMDKLGQLAPGGRVTFDTIDVETARLALLSHEEEFLAIKPEPAEL
jgi:biotin-dependent carboxylase-like uncharacterized protein